MRTGDVVRLIGDAEFQDLTYREFAKLRGHVVRNFGNGNILVDWYVGRILIHKDENPRSICTVIPAVE